MPLLLDRVSKKEYFVSTSENYGGAAAHLRFQVEIGCCMRCFSFCFTDLVMAAHAIIRASLLRASFGKTIINLNSILISPLKTGAAGGYFPVCASDSP